MRWLIATSLLLLSFTADKQVSDGKTIIEFNAGFNKGNTFRDLGKVNGAKLYRVDIETKPGLKKQYNIKSVPTIIYFVDGEERYRWTAGLDMKLHIHFSEIQDVVNRY